MLNRWMRTSLMIAVAMMLGCGGPELGQEPGSAQESLSLVGDVLQRRVAPTAELHDLITVTLPRASVLPPTVRLPGERPVVCAPSKNPDAVVGTDPLDPAFVPAGPASYSLLKTSRLFVGALLSDVCGPHVGHFDVFRPDGSFQGRYVVAFEAAPGGVGTRPVDGGYVVFFELPMSGTEVTGSWAVRFALDTDVRANGATTFGLF